MVYKMALLYHMSPIDVMNSDSIIMRITSIGAQLSKDWSQEELENG